jgi:hypothetical protein
MNKSIISIKDSIVKDLRYGTTYREILRKYPELKSTSMIHRIKKIYIDQELPHKKKLSEATKSKIMVTAVQRKALEKSELIIENHINILETFKYSIKNLDEIQQLHKKDTDNIYIMLGEIIKRMDVYFNSDGNNDEEQLKIRNSLLNAANKVADIHKNSLLRIKAIDSLKGQMDSYLKFKIDVAGLEQINTLIKAFIEGTGILPDEQYFKYKKAVIDNCEFARVFFDKWDEGIYDSAESTKAVVVDRNEEAVSCNSNEQE